MVYRGCFQPIAVCLPSLPGASPSATVAAELEPIILDLDNLARHRYWHLQVLEDNRCRAPEQGSRFDGVILDLTVRDGMGGREAIEQLLEFNPEVKAIVSSGYSTDPIKSAYQDYGFKGVVSKPYGTEELLNTLREVIPEIKA